MSPEIVQSMVFAKREGCPVNRSSSLTGRFSAIFRDFPNTRPPTAEIGYPSASAAGAGWSGFAFVGCQGDGRGR